MPSGLIQENNMWDWIKDKWKKFLSIFFGTVLAASVGGVAIDAQINPYEFKDGVYKTELIQTLPESGVASVKLLENEPKVILGKWNDEVQLGVKYLGLNTRGSRVAFTNRIEWKEAKQELHAYPLEAKEGMEGGGFEIEIVLNEKPATNVFEFQIDGAENLDFFYQPELTQKEIDRGIERLENIVGSYAVYHKTKNSHKIGSINYATGKAFHIYRPKVFDNNNNEIWGELGYKNGVLSIIIPQNFLDNAVYPVKIDPTFGFTTSGGSDNSLTANDLAGSSFTAPSDVDTVTSLTLWQRSARFEFWKAVIVLNSTEVIITNGVGNSVDGTLNIEEATSTFSTPPTLSPSTDYILAVVHGTSGSGIIRFDAGATDQGTEDTTNSFSTPTNPTDGVRDTNKHSIYVTYVASGGVAAEVQSEHWFNPDF